MTEELGPGIYEALVTEGLRARLDALADSTPATTRALASAEAPDRIPAMTGHAVARFTVRRAARCQAV